MSNTTLNETNFVSNRQRSEAGQQPVLRPGVDALNYMKAYAKAKPDVAALWCFGLGIVVGWKIKPW